MRFRSWYEVTIQTGAGKRLVSREERFRGDHALTVARAIGRWRTRHTRHGNALVVVHAIWIAKHQPRPMPPEETHADGGLSRRNARN